MLAIIANAFTYLTVLIGKLFSASAIPAWLTNLASVLLSVLKTRIPLPAV